MGKANLRSVLGEELRQRREQMRPDLRITVPDSIDSQELFRLVRGGEERLTVCVGNNRVRRAMCDEYRPARHWPILARLSNRYFMNVCVGSQG